MTRRQSKVAEATKGIAESTEADESRAPLSVDTELSSGSTEDSSREGIRLGFLIHDVSRMRRNAYDQFMKPLGMTRAQWWVLAHLSRHDGMMQTQLADIMEVGKASLGDVIESLAAANLIDRHPDPKDRRAKRVYLTRTAQTLIKRMTIMEAQFNDQSLAELSSDERAALSSSLIKIKNAVSRMISRSGA